MTDDGKDVVHASIIPLAKQLEGYEHYHQFMVRGLIESNVDDYIDLPMIALMVTLLVASQACFQTSVLLTYPEQIA